MSISSLTSAELSRMNSAKSALFNEIVHAEAEDVRAGCQARVEDSGLWEAIDDVVRRWWCEVRAGRYAEMRGVVRSEHVLVEVLARWDFHASHIPLIPLMTPRGQRILLSQLHERAMGELHSQGRDVIEVFEHFTVDGKPVEALLVPLFGHLPAVSSWLQARQALAGDVDVTA